MMYDYNYYLQENAYALINYNDSNVNHGIIHQSTFVTLPSNNSSGEFYQYCWFGFRYKYCHLLGGISLTHCTNSVTIYHGPARGKKTFW